MTNYDVLYCKDPNYNFDTELTRTEITNGDRFLKVCSVNADGLYKVYRKMQAPDKATMKECGHSTMDIGDIIYDVAKDEYYQVDMLGFSKVQ